MLNGGGVNESFQGKKHYLCTLVPYNDNLLYRIMTFIERLNNEKTNLDGDIFMYEDGSEFIKAFERSAYMLCRSFKPMEPLVYNNKEYGGMYVKIGYSKKSVEKYTSHPDYDYSRQEDGDLIIHRLKRKQPMDFPEDDYAEWKNKAVASKSECKEKGGRRSPIVPNTTMVEEPVHEPEPSINAEAKIILADILAQQLSNFTPMQALNYLNSLQERIRNAGISD